MHVIVSQDRSLSRINVMKPWLGAEEAAAVAEVVASGWVAQGPRVARFEAAFAAAQQASHAVAVSNCTTALHLALMLAGIGPRRRRYGAVPFLHRHRECGRRTSVPGRSSPTSRRTPGT